MKTTVLTFIILTTLFSCDSDKLSVNCDPNAEVVHEADNWEGRMIIMEDYDKYAISYHVPGTIDSNYTGLVCGELTEEFRVNGLKVYFSGNFIDDNGQIQPLARFGGQQFFFFELNDIKKRTEELDSN